MMTLRKLLQVNLLAACVWPLLSLESEAAPADQPVSWFSTGGETIYHLKAARTSLRTPRSIIAAAYSPFDLDVGDIDGDGFDECAVALADGSLYLIDHDGKLLAKVFEGKPPLYSVKVVSRGPGKIRIICGGPERMLYHVSPRGEVIAKISTPGTIKNIDTGNFSKIGPASLVVGMDLDFTRALFCLHSLPALEIQDEPRDTKESQ